ncbi:unnamed protein product [Mytilus coruscus]|uniref:CCHC-type domain-containing protein n=1 Tax=Mytilus coruscus TaxID=42192 RepID=A0A6J8BGF8_MYTCO|nr:unnamed protein product [Mytilus coruscus]
MDDLQQHISTLEEETRRTNFGDVTGRTVQTQLQRTDDAPTLFGPYISEQGPGVRPKQVQFNTTSAAPCTSSGCSVEISPILKYNQRNARQVVNNQEKVHTPGKNTRREIKLANYDGSGEWVDFKSHFDACAIINIWDEYEKGLYLAAALRGHTQSVFSDLPTDKKMDYETLVKSLEERFAPPNQNELYRVQLKERRQRASETLPELGQTIRRLVNRAYPLAPIEVKETLSKDYVLDALHDSEMRIKIKQSRSQNLNQAICLAVELEAFYKAEKRQDFVKPQMRATHVDTSTQEVSSKDDKFTEMMDLFSKQLKSLRMELNEFKKSGQRNSADPEWKRNQQCYNCVKYGHFKRECRLRKQGGNENGQYRNHENGSARPVHSQTRKQRRKQIKLNVQNNSTKEAGAYIDVVIGNIKSSFLVDTGATVTLISNKVFNSLRKEEMPKLNQVVQTIMSANGTELNVAGKEFHIWIEQKEYLSEAVVADLAIEGIIGLDFLRENGCLINLQEEHMVCHNQKIPLNFTGELGCYRVSVVEDTCIQPGTEALVQGHINEYPSTKNEVGLGVIEPCDKFIARDNALMARTLVKASEIVPQRFMNVSNVVKTIRAGTIVGNISPVKDVISDNKNITVKQNDPVLSIELQKLLSNCSGNLSQEQKRGVENLLNEYKDLFAASDRDLGRTNLVRHAINTGNNAPVKQPPRRTPIYMREEVNRHIDGMLERAVIEPAHGPWSSGIVMVKKKDGTTRFCVDYRKVNDLTVKDAYPLPRIDDSLEQLSGNKWFSLYLSNCFAEEGAQRPINRRYKRSNEIEKLGIACLTDSIRDELRRTRRAEQLKKSNKKKRKRKIERISSRIHKTTQKHCIVEKVQEGHLHCSKEEVERNLYETHSDEERETPLGYCPRVKKEQPTIDFETKEPT